MSLHLKKGRTGQRCEGKDQPWLPWPWDGEDQDPDGSILQKVGLKLLSSKEISKSEMVVPERLHSLHPWRYSKPNWAQPWATCLSWYCFEQRGYCNMTCQPQLLIRSPWYFTLTETIIVKSSLQKLVFDGNHLSYFWKDGDKSYIDQLRDLCSLVYFGLCHKELPNIPCQKFLGCPQPLSKLFINNKLLCFLIGKHRLKPSNKASKMKSKILGKIKNKCHIMMVYTICITKIYV